MKMKKFAKICLIITLVLVLAGATLLGSGLALGGTAVASDALTAIRDHSDNLWGTSILEHHIYVTPEDEPDDSFFDDDWDDEDSNDPEDDHDDTDDWDEEDGHWSETFSTTMEDGKVYDFSYGSLKSLDIDIAAADLVIETGSVSDRIEFISEYKLTSNRLLLSDNGKDQIRISSQDHHFIGDPTVKVTIRIPEDYVMKSLDLELNAGNVNSTASFMVTEADISVNAGNLVIKQMTAQELDIEIDAGNTEVTLPGSTADYNYDLSCSFGRIEINGMSGNGFENRYNQNNHADKDISIDCSTGNISVFFE